MRTPCEVDVVVVVVVVIAAVVAGVVVVVGSCRLTHSSVWLQTPNWFPTMHAVPGVIGRALSIEHSLLKHKPLWHGENIHGVRFSCPMQTFCVEVVVVATVLGRAVVAGPDVVCIPVVSATVVSVTVVSTTVRVTVVSLVTAVVS